MLAIAARAAAVIAIAGAAVAIFAWIGAPSSSREEPLIVDADGVPIADADGFRPLPGVDATGPHELVSVAMPEPRETPRLPEGVLPLTFADLWQDGPFELAEAASRVGAPDRSLFPDGATDEDVKNFFLDIADMRSLQLLEGSVRDELDGKRVRIAGYTTPVGFEEEETRFLLVPELGACIHVPPPPPNQIVYVERADTTPEMFAPVWIIGTLRADPVATILADVGYRMEDVSTIPYDAR